MMNLEDFEGIEGCRWAALTSDAGQVQFSEHAPPEAAKKVSLIGKVLAGTPLHMETANLAFDRGRVLVRRNPPRTLMLFCDLEVNTAMVDVVARELNLPLEVTLDASGEPLTSAHPETKSS